jgi:hypothetical protein
MLTTPGGIGAAAPGLHRLLAGPASVYPPLASALPDLAVLAAMSEGCFTVADIRKEAGLSDRVVRRVLRDLVKHKLADRRRSTRHNREEIFVLR